MGCAAGEGGDRLDGRQGEASVKAVVLVGGYGTRLLPLTETTKKELLPLVDRPILDHVLDRLVRHGVDEVVMSSPYLEGAFGPFIDGRRGSPSIVWITESEPLGTGGAIVHALGALGDEPFFALNGDILTDLDLTAMRAAHRSRGAAVTIALHRVDDARAFGLVETDEDGRVLAFREKPEAAVPGDINAGTYLLDPAALAPWNPDRAISIEREIFPSVIGDGQLVTGFASPAYWMDLGTPEKYLAAHADMLAGALDGISYDAPWCHPSSSVDATAILGRSVAVGAGATIGAGADVDGSVLHPEAGVGAGAMVRGSILGAASAVGAGAVMSSSVLGAGSSVPASMVVDGARVAPGTIADGEPRGG
jgi:mannose-1-phosphate guanylyltransferase